jgi:hypothetical protein
MNKLFCVTIEASSYTYVIAENKQDAERWAYNNSDLILNDGDPEVDVLTMEIKNQNEVCKNDLDCYPYPLEKFLGTIRTSRNPDHEMNLEKWMEIIFNDQREKELHEKRMSLMGNLFEQK